MEIHPLCLVLPDMKSSEYKGLVDDIRAKGLLHAIVTYEGMVLDGRHRLKACAELGVEPRFDTYTGSDPAGYVVGTCQHRSLTASQRALIAAGFLAYEREQAKKRMLAGGHPVENFPQGTGKARDKAGERLHICGRTVADAEKILIAGVPEVVEMVKAGEMTVNEAKKVVKLSPAAQQRVMEAPRAQRRKTIETARVRSEARKHRDAPRVVASEPSTPFVRKVLQLVERLTMICAEEGVKDQRAMADKFISEMDWECDALSIQLDRCDPTIMFLSLIRQYAHTHRGSSISERTPIFASIHQV